MIWLYVYLGCILYVFLTQFIENREEEFFTLGELLGFLFSLLISPVIVILHLIEVVDNYLLQNGIDIRDVIIWKRKDNE